MYVWLLILLLYNFVNTHPSQRTGLGNLSEMLEYRMRSAQTPVTVMLWWWGLVLSCSSKLFLMPAVMGTSVDTTNCTVLVCPNVTQSLSTSGHSNIGTHLVAPVTHTC